MQGMKQDPECVCCWKKKNANSLEFADFTVTDRSRGRLVWLYLNASYVIRALLFWLYVALNIGIMLQFGNSDIKIS